MVQIFMHTISAASSRCTQKYKLSKSMAFIPTNVLKINTNLLLKLFSKHIKLVNLFIGEVLAKLFN